MHEPETLGDVLAKRGVSRRGFLKYCATLASLMALPPSVAAQMADKLTRATRQSVIYLSFQECTGCLESLSRTHSPTLEGLLFDLISLDYQETLLAAAGHAAEEARANAMRANSGKFVLMVDGAIPLKDGGVYSTIAGRTNIEILKEAVPHAAAVIAVGTCSSFGGLPHANPNPTGAVSVGTLMEKGLIERKPLINVSGCPPIPVVISGVVAHFLTLGTLPELDGYGRPKVFFGDTIHDRCYRRPFYDQGKFAKTFDDEGARNGWCLYELGCKGPTTYNACATAKWNGGVSFPIESGHGCLGCSEPDFWDAGSFYAPLPAPRAPLSAAAGAAIAVGVAAGAAVGLAGLYKRKKAQQAHTKLTVDDLETEKKP
ncbi:MAG: twin-arginine translocation signal domain-containing protein [Gammaproteobacteria bacterium]|nr:MAG: twin-arginine translocation signal domain-containing protein [Gammaproteobacteria bacterium]